MRARYARISAMDFWTAMASALLLIFAAQAQAQTFQVLHAFAGGRDGANPGDGLTIDRAGNLYGSASAGGNQVSGCSNAYGTTGCGTVFELARAGPGWILRPLYEFTGTTNAEPSLGVVFGPDGALYGLTAGTRGNGGVFRLVPPASICPSFTCSWQETVLHQFTGQPDGSSPTSRVVFDSAGNIFGTTFFGGAYNRGAAYELSPGNGGWTESVIQSFNWNSQGLGVTFPAGYMAIDSQNNIYGAAYCNQTLGCFYGSVFQLQPSQSGWTLNDLYDFNGFNGYAPAGVIRDPAGNIYGVTTGAAGNDSGTIYEISPSNGGWNYSLVYDFGFEDNASGLVMDSAGNLYGVNSSQFNDGYVFKLTRAGNGWSFSTLHTFHGADGAGPYGQLVLDSAGNLYGTTVQGGTYSYGVIWEITQ